MEFFNSAVDVLKTLVVALGAGLGVWGAVNLMEGYGGDNPSRWWCCPTIPVVWESVRVPLSRSFLPGCVRV